MVFARQPVHGEAPGDGLLVQRVGIAGQGVQLAGLRLALGADDVLHAGQFQQVAGFGGVEEPVRADRRFVAAGEAAQRDGADAVAITFSAGRDLPAAYLQLAVVAPGGQHGLENGKRHARLVAKAADRPLARVEADDAARLVGKGVVAAIVVAHILRELPVAAGGAGPLDPGMFVGRDGLGRQLTADPVALLAEDDASAEAQGREGRGHAARPPADDEKVRFPLAAYGSLPECARIEKYPVHRARKCANNCAALSFTFMDSEGSAK